MAALDVKKDPEGNYRVFSHTDKRILGFDAIERAVQLENAGAGELLVTSVDHDGVMEGYDCELICRISSAVTIPVIVAGGAGRLEDFSLALKYGASAVGAASIFHFTEHTPLEVKRHLKDSGISVRA
jgi:cyclase